MGVADRELALHQARNETSSSYPSIAFRKIHTYNRYPEPHSGTNQQVDNGVDLILTVIVMTV